MSLKSRLLFSYELDESSGNAVDAHGSGVALVETDGTIGPGSGGGREFNAADTEWFESTDAIFQRGDTSYTIEITAKFDELPGAGAFATIASLESNGGQRGWRIDYYPDGAQIRFVVFNSDGGVVAIPGFSITPTSGQLLHIVCWYYVGGGVAGITVNNGTPVTATHTGGASSGHTLHQFLGKRDTGGYDYFDGTLRRFRMWSRVLTVSERVTLYASGSTLAYASLTAAAQYPAAVLADSPLSYLSLNGNKTDSGVDGRTWAEPFGQAPTYAEDSLIDSSPSNKAAAFTGDLLTNGVKPTATSVTIEAWVKPTTIGSSNYLFSVPNGIGLRLDSAGLTFYPDGGFGPSRNAAYTFVAGTKYHVAATFNGTSRNVTFYVNGAQVGTVGVANAAIDWLGDSQMAWGGVHGVGGQNLDAVIDEAALYSTDLSAARIAAHWDAAQVVATGGPFPFHARRGMAGGMKNLAG